MKKYFRPKHQHQYSVKGPTSEMCDHQEKECKYKKSSNSKSQLEMQHHCNQGHRHHHNHHPSDDNRKNVHSAEDIHDLYPSHQNQRDHDRTHHHHHPHHSHHCHVSVSESTSSSSSCSSSSSTSSSSFSSSSSSSFSSSSKTSSSSSSLSSENSSNSSDRYRPKRPQHSQSFTDISDKHKYFEEDDDTVPLINARGNLNKAYTKQKRDMGKSTLSCPTKGGLKSKHMGNDGRVHKAKSMEDLPTDRRGIGNGNRDEQEENNSEAKKNFLKEKMKFSAFLNEITRQVLSPMRLTSLGVTDAQQPQSAGQVSPRSRETDSSTDKPRQSRSGPSSPDSMRSSKQSQTSKRSHSSRLSHSKSFHHHSHHSSSPPSHLKHRRRSCHSLSPTQEHHFHLPSSKHYHHHHHHHHEDYNSSNQSQQHGDHHTTSHCHDRSPVYKHKNHHGPTHYNKDQTNTSHFHGDKHHEDHYNSGNHDKHPYSQDYHHDFHHGHGHSHRDNYNSSHHGGNQTVPHHHDEHHCSGHYSSQPNSRPTTPCHHEHYNPTSKCGEPQGPTHQHHHEDHHREAHQHHHGDHRSGLPHFHHPDHHHQGHHQPHSNQYTEATLHHGDHHKETHHHHHRDHQHRRYQHHSQHHQNKPQHHLQDHHSSGHNHLQGDHKSEYCGHQHGEHHSPGHHHHHGTHHSSGHRHHHGDHHGPGHHHRDLHSEAHPHHHGEHHSSGHHHKDEHSEARCHHHGDHHSPGHHRHHGDQHSEAHHHQHTDHHSTGRYQYHGDERNPSHQHHYDEEHSDTSHWVGHPTESPSHPSHCKKNDHDNKRRDDGQTISLPLHRNPESLVSKSSLRNTTSSSGVDEEQTSFTGSSSHEAKTHALGRVMVLPDQNDGLHPNLLKTAVRMEYLGEEFISSQKFLETELQRTRMELSNLMERFKRLQDDCSSTQQTNNLLEQKLHSMLQTMEGERGRLNHRISELTEQLTDVKIANTMEAMNMASVLHKNSLHSLSDDTFAQMLPPIAPPPAQFMDSHSYGKDKSSGQEQPLGSVPEEEESDWSEVGDETHRLILTGPNTGQIWRHQEADMDKDSVSGSEELVRRHSSYPLQIPHLQFTIHNEFLPPTHTSSCPSGFKNLTDSLPDEGSYRFTTSPNIKSAILIRSASLEEIPLTRHHMQEELRGTTAMMNLHHSADEVTEDLNNEIIHHWRTSKDRDTVIRRLTKSTGAEAESSLASLQSAEQMLKQMMCGPSSNEGGELGRAEVHGWAGGIPDEVLHVERTQL